MGLMGWEGFVGYSMPNPDMEPLIWLKNIFAGVSASVRLDRHCDQCRFYSSSKKPGMENLSFSFHDRPLDAVKSAPGSGKQEV